MRRLKLAAAIALVVVLGGWAIFHHRSAEARTRRYFDMSYFASLDSSAIELAALRVLPIGTREPKVREYLSEVRIGSDGMSSYYPPGTDRRAVVRIEFDPASPLLVKRHFALVMRFDAESRLERVEVRTGSQGRSGIDGPTISAAVTFLTPEEGGRSRRRCTGRVL